MTKLPAPHNNLFHFAMTHLPCARSLIETQFSGEVLRELDLDTLRVEKESFIDAALRDKFSDILLSACRQSDELSDQHGVPNRSYVYVLLEHKSVADPLTAMQLLGYIVRIHERRVREGLRLCPILPLVVYHGASPWAAADNVQQLFDASPAMLNYQVNFRFPVLDLGLMRDDELQGTAILQSVLRLLKYGRSDQLRVKLKEILELVDSAFLGNGVAEWVQAIGVYVMAVNDGLEKDELVDIVQSVFPTQIEPGSLADRLVNQGRKEGLEKGKLVGRIQMLQELLEQPISPTEELQLLALNQLDSILLSLRQQLRERDSRR
jgi:predicted transposase/invertase (TIGR01784 family)